MRKTTIKKYLTGFAAAASVALLLAGCSGKGDKSPAMQARDNTIAQLADSIKTVEAEIASCKEGISANTETVQQLIGQFTFVDNPRQVEGYTILRSWQGRYPLAGAGIVARMRADEGFELVAANPKAFSQIALKSGSEEVSTDVVPHDQALNYRTSNLTTVAFSGAAADSVGSFAASHRNDALTLQFVENGGVVATLPLSEDVRTMLAETWTLYNAESSLKRLERRLPLLSRKAQAYELERQRLQGLNPDSLRKKK